ncbi:hypothetical protein AlacWU_09134 [Aspergillus niger]|nr:hypothetical protein AlacWU_09134 [Aspergillus niger]
MIATRLFGPGGYCRRYGVTVLLATHTDEIVILERGRIVQNGLFEKVMQLHKPASVHRSLVSTDEIAGHMASATDEDNELNNDTVKALVSDSLSPLRREGTWSVYNYYYQSAGFIPFATCLAFIVVEAVSGDFKTLWIQWWVEANEESPNKDVGFASCVVKLVILCIVSKYLAVAVPALLVSLVILQRYYLRTSRQVRLLDLEAKAPLYTHFTEAVHGVTTLRAFRMERWFQEKMHMLLNKSQGPFYMLYCIQQWLTLVMGLIVAALAVIIAATTTSLADQYNGAAVGVALSLILTFNSTLSSTLRSWTSLETSIGAVSRVQQFVQDTPREANNDLMGSVVPRALGHSHFTIEFDNITAAYGQARPPVLKNLSLMVHPGEKIAICGASGSGKSSIVMSLLRMSEIQSGRVLIGGCDISGLERQAIHSAINVIPQDLFLLSGTVRFNLDPFEMATDERIAYGHVLYFNLVSGERQLLALARALVVPRPILVLDEATSSVDRETEALMQDVIEQDFRQQTVISVVHRFAYVDRFDRIAFLRDGEMIECDTPQALLGRDCNFRELYRAWKRL